MSKYPQPRFDAPPLIEVVFSVTFATLAGFQTPHFGAYWKMIQKQFPSIQDTPPLQSFVEGNPGEAQQLSVELRSTPPMPRVWFINDDGARLIQLQADRFIFNWKKIDAAEYTSFDVIYEEFMNHFRVYLKFLEDESLPPPSIRQLELTYVNVVEDSKRWQTLDEVVGVFKEHALNKNMGFLPAPEGINWQTQYPLPDNQGRLHTSAQSMLSQEGETPALRLDMTARGVPKNITDETIADWFNLAHAYIVNGFADITNETIQYDLWKRTS